MKTALAEELAPLACADCCNHWCTYIPLVYDNGWELITGNTFTAERYWRYGGKAYRAI